nr:hypothetical protein [Pseudopedobacter sp.]
MYLKIFILIIFNSFCINFCFAQQSKTKSDFNDLIKFIEKNYRSNDDVWNICDKNFTIVYFDIDKNNDVKKIYSEDDLGNLIAKKLQFTLDYHLKDLKTENQTFGVFFILKNISSNCVDIKNGYNSASLVVEELLKKISLKSKTVLFSWSPIILQTPNPIK